MRLRFLAVIAALCATSVAGAEEPLHTAVDAAFPPHASVRLDGTLEGFQIDLANEIAKRLGRSITIEGGNFAGLIPALNAGRYDFLAAPVTVTRERAEGLLFTEGYLFTAFQFGIKRGTAPILALADIKGKTVAVNRGSAYDIWVQQNAAKLGFEPLVLDTFTDATMAVVQGRAYAQLGGNTAVKYAATKNRQYVPDFVLAETKAHWSIPVRKDNVALRNRIEDAIECMKKDGTVARMSEKWFGAAPGRGDAELTVFPGYGVPDMPGYDPTPHHATCT